MAKKVSKKRRAPALEKTYTTTHIPGLQRTTRPGRGLHGVDRDDATGRSVDKYKSTAGGPLHGTDMHSEALRHHRKPEVQADRRARTGRAMKEAAKEMAIAGATAGVGGAAGTILRKGGQLLGKGAYKLHRAARTIQGTKGAAGKSLPVPKKPSVTVTGRVSKPSKKLKRTSKQLAEPHEKKVNWAEKGKSRLERDYRYEKIDADSTVSKAKMSRKEYYAKYGRDMAYDVGQPSRGMVGRAAKEGGDPYEVMARELKSKGRKKATARGVKRADKVLKKEEAARARRTAPFRAALNKEQKSYEKRVQRAVRKATKGQNRRPVPPIPVGERKKKKDEQRRGKK